MPFRSVHVVSPVRGKTRARSERKNKAQNMYMRIYFHHIYDCFDSISLANFQRLNFHCRRLNAEFPSLARRRYANNEKWRNSSNISLPSLQREKLIFEAIVWMKKKSFNLILGEWRWNCLGISLQKRRNYGEKKIFFLSNAQDLWRSLIWFA